ncbi:MAG: heavy-metal-associated domain-containing protein, partial [Sporomusa sp.]
MANGNTNNTGRLNSVKREVLALAAQKNIKQTVFRVGGLKGDHCRDRIEHTLSHLHGVTSVKVDL